MSFTSRTSGAGERGVALVTTMLIMMLMSALMIGLTAVVTSDQRYRLVDRERVKAFYGAHSGLEKLNAELANLFFVNVAPNSSQIAALAKTPPTIDDITFATTGADAYGITVGTESQGTISTGPYAGLIALKKLYTLTSTASSSGGGEVKLTRKVETVAIPVFQFGMFSEVDLSFSAADDFDFGGRVHTNANLFLAQGGGADSELYLRDKVTAVGEVIRQTLSNGASIDTSGSTRAVMMATATNTFRNLLRTEGSLEGGVGSAERSGWQTTSLSDYNGYIRDGTTGAKRLDLPLIAPGVEGTPIDLIRRPSVNEDTANPTLLGERYFSQVSLRILLSDTAADITGLPDVTSTAPIALSGDWRSALPTGLSAVSANNPPIALSDGVVSVALTANPGSGANITLEMASVPTYYRPAQLTVYNGTTLEATINCTGRSLANQRFTGCRAVGANEALISGWTVQANIDGVAVTPTTVDGNQTISSTVDTNFEVASVLNFARELVWLKDNAATPAFTDNLVRCTGNTTTQLTGCGTVVAAVNTGDFVTNGYASDAGTATIGGFIKIEMQDTNDVWTDVTAEILNYGIGAPDVTGTCADPTPNAILRIQRLRDNVGLCNFHSQSQRPTDWWPQALFDAREAVYRDDYASNDIGDLVTLRLGGVMYYIALDATNLSRWFAGAVAPYDSGSGSQAKTVNGYSVYFSDRRSNRNASNAETGEYGFENVVNPDSATGTPNATLDTGEDFNQNGTLETYGQYPSYNGTYNSVPPGAVSPLDSSARPTTNITRSSALVNRAILFRRALKLVNGGITGGANPIISPGLTIASENPVYIQGNWNASSTGFDEPNRATSVAADAVTMLSNNWNDANSFTSPYNADNRARTETYYRVAIISGKGPIFPRPGNGEGATFGTDGGAHSFLRFLEGSSATVNYRGSMATFFYHRQALSPFKCCGNVVYDVPTRNYIFDTDFLDPDLLPPLTPVFRDLNALGFAQETRPN